uniref:Photosystem I assembly protein ycf4 n=1 Tax=Ixonanthes chinensis TaxID=257781 RepID=A0A5J6XID0_9ROSI|nr:photosystem I assembly protein ycf4 [Ixonanthes chinensis]
MSWRSERIWIELIF